VAFGLEFSEVTAKSLCNGKQTPIFRLRPDYWNVWENGKDETWTGRPKPKHVSVSFLAMMLSQIYTDIDTLAA